MSVLLPSLALSPPLTELLAPPHTRRSGFDSNRVYSVSVLPGQEREHDLSKAQAHLFDFIQTFRVGGEFKYRCVLLPPRLASASLEASKQRWADKKASCG